MPVTILVCKRSPSVYLLCSSLINYEIPGVWLEGMRLPFLNGTGLTCFLLVQYLAVSVLLFASQEVGFKKFATTPDDPATLQNSVRGIGYMGVHTLLWFWPLLVVLHFSGLERFELPSVDVMRMLFLNAFLDVIFAVGLFMCIALSSPLVAT